MAVVVAAFVVVVGFEAFEYDVYVVFLGEDVGEVFNQFQYVAGDVGRAFGVDGYFGTRADVFQGFLDSDFKCNTRVPVVGTDLRIKHLAFRSQVFFSAGGSTHLEPCVSPDR